jgi:transposase
MLKVGEVKMIRHMVLNQGKSIREVSRETGRSRNTVRKYLNQSEPEYRKKAPRDRPVFDAVKPRIDALVEELKGRTTPKQRMTGTLIHRMLRQEGFCVGITLVRDCLREMRRRKAEVYVPLKHHPGDAAQVDFFQVTVDVRGKREKAWMFLMRLMFSGRDYVRIYENCDQICFLDAHVRALESFGAVPKRLVYDNLKPAVIRRVGAFRELSERFEALSSHYLFEPCFARPGEGHDKGGVESRGKGIRLRHLTPIPRGDSLEEINMVLLADLDEEARHKINRVGKTVHERFCEEKALMRPLPEHPFEARLPVFTRVSKSATIQLRGAQYSVPSRWAGLKVAAYVGPGDIRVVCRGAEEILPRIPKGEKRILYRHYLRDLSRKPQAVRQVAPELLRELGNPFDRFWKRLLEHHTPLESARRLSRVLGLILEHGEKRVGRALETLLAKGDSGLLDLSDLSGMAPERVSVPSSLSRYRIETARASDYDALLKGGLS